MKNDFIISARSVRNEHTSEKIISQLRNFIDLINTRSECTDWEITYSEEDSLSLTVRNSLTEECMQSATRQLVINVLIGAQSGTATCLGAQWSDWLETLEHAIGIAQLSQPDPFHALPPEQYFSQPIPTLEICSPEEVSFQSLVNRAIDLEKIASGLQGHHQKGTRLQSDGASIGADFHWIVRANSKGLWAIIPSSSFAQSVSLLAHLDDYHESDGAYEYCRRFTDLKNIDTFALLAQDRVCGKIGKKKIPTGNYPVIFSPRCARGWIKHLCSALSGRSQYLKSTFLLDYCDKPILPQWVNISDNPHSPWGKSSYPIDSDGLVTRPHEFIVDGVVKEYLLSYYSALRLNRTPNALGDGLKNVHMTTNIESLNEIVKKYPQCIVVDGVMGNGVNLIQGSYSQGIEGFLYQNGEKIHPLQEVTIATTLLPFYQSLEYHANDAEGDSGFQIGSLAFPMMRVSSQ
ncbi:MAG: hypothetical protein FJ161_00125 [Gammaproteobacteria bacterium]|nr:hypothetical protein [Gammaproteobacteria bacterium]